VQTVFSQTPPMNCSLVARLLSGKAIDSTLPMLDHCLGIPKQDTQTQSVQAEIDVLTDTISFPALIKSNVTEDISFEGHGAA
jgi:hypothetical protein